MARYKVKLIMSEEFVINAESEEEAGRKAIEQFGYSYLVDDLEVTEISSE